MAQEDVNLHQGEKAASTPPQPQTADALRLLSSTLGAAAGPQFALLSTALGALVRGLTAALTDNRKQASTLASNKAAVPAAPLQLPTVRPPDLSAASRTISTTLATVVTPDTVRLNQSMALAQNVRDPERLQTFKKTLIDQTSDEMNQETRQIGEHLKTVQGMREQVEST